MKKINFLRNIFFSFFVVLNMMPLCAMDHNNDMEKAFRLSMESYYQEQNKKNNDDRYFQEAIRLSLLEEMKKPKRMERKNSFKKVKIGSSIAWQLLEMSGFDSKKLKTDEKKSIPLVSGREDFLIKRLAKNVIMIQLPVARQGASECAINAITMCDTFFKLKFDAKRFFDCFLSNSFEKKVAKLKFEVSNGGGSATLLQPGSLYNIYNRRCSESWFDPKGCRKLENGIHHSIATLGDSAEDLLNWDWVKGFIARRKECREKVLPEVFITYLGGLFDQGHWVALRIELMPNGETAILLGDSISASLFDETEIFDRITECDKYYKPLAQLLSDL